MPVLYPNKLNYQAFKSIVKVLGDAVEIQENENRVTARLGKFTDSNELLSVYVYFRKHAVGNRFMPAIRVSLNKIGDQMVNESISVGSYDQIPLVKQRIAEFLAAQ